MITAFDLFILFVIAHVSGAVAGVLYEDLYAAVRERLALRRERRQLALSMPTARLLAEGRK